MNALAFWLVTAMPEPASSVTLLELANTVLLKMSFLQMVPFRNAS